MVHNLFLSFACSLFCLNAIAVASDVGVDVGLSSKYHLEGETDVPFDENSTEITNRGFAKLDVPDEPCNHVDNFINSTSAVLTCVSSKSTPATYCTECRAYFDEWYLNYNAMRNRTSCRKLLRDDTSVATSPSLLGRVANQTNAYWNNSRCQKCIDMNQTELVRFRELDGELAQCLDSNNTCADCLNTYKEMTELYVNLGNGGGCVELKDRINRTQHSWNTKGCKPPTPDITTAMILSAFFAILPAIFYTYLRIFGARRTRRLLRAGAPAATTPATLTLTGTSGGQQPLLGSDSQGQTSSVRS